MGQYIAKRVVLFIPTLLLVSIIIFGLLRIIPGDPAELILIGEEGEGNYTEAQLKNMKREMGTDRHLVVQYGTWVWGLLRGDFGKSMFYGTPVVDDLKARIPITAQLSVMAMFFAMAFSVPLGVLSAIKQNSWLDYTARMIAVAGGSYANLLGWCPGYIFPNPVFRLVASIGIRRLVGGPKNQPATTRLSRPYSLVFPICFHS